MSELHFNSLLARIKYNLPYVRSEKALFSGLRKFEEFEDTIATTYFVLRELFGCEPNEAITSITDGPGDNSIDAIYLDYKGGDCVDIYIVQTKFKKEFKHAFNKSEVHSLMKKFEDLLNNRPFERMNSRLEKKWAEVVEACKCPDYTFKFLFVTNGIAPNTDVREPAKHSTYDYEFLGYDKLTGLAHSLRKISPKEISFRTSSRSILEEAQANITALVCSIPVNQLIQIYENGGRDQILDRNIRFYLGKSNAVNKQIINTALNEEGERAEHFWFQNNGISIVCDRLSSKKNPDGYYDIKLVNPLIVNGGQTTKTLYLLKTENRDSNFPEMQVMLRIFQTNDSEVINKITKSTNSQSPITLKDLEANNEIQDMVKVALRSKEIFLETKHNEYEKVEFSEIDKKAIIKNDTLIQYYVSIFAGKFSSAKANKSKCFQENFKHIFSVENKNLLENLEKTYIIYRYIIKKERGKAGTYIKHANLSIAHLVSESIKIKTISPNIPENKLDDAYLVACRKLEKIIKSESKRLGLAFSFNKLFKSSDLEIMLSNSK